MKKYLIYFLISEFKIFGWMIFGSVSTKNTQNKNHSTNMNSEIKK